MPYVNRELLRIALEDLRGYAPLPLISVPCMLSRGVPVCSSAREAQEKNVAFGSPDERQWLGKHFKLVGGGADKPYFNPGSGGWVQARYPDRTLQRRRKDFEASVFFHPTKNTWAFRTEGKNVLAAQLDNEGKAIPLIALMVWMWREHEIDSLDDGLLEFKSYIGMTPDPGGFVGPVYHDRIEDKYIDAEVLIAEPLAEEEIVELVGGALPPPMLEAGGSGQPSGLAGLVKTLYRGARESDISVSEGLFERVVGGWLVGDVVVLVGATGTGKTTLAREIGAGLREHLGDDNFVEMFFEVTPDYDAAQFVGYENLAGDFTPGQYAREGILAGQPTAPHLVVLDEWNLAQIDTYFATVLSVLETGEAIRLPGSVPQSLLDEEAVNSSTALRSALEDGRWPLPRDTLFLATCNSWMEEPETRLAISGPVKRRCRIITLRNVLVERFENEGSDAIKRFCDETIRRESRKTANRMRSGEHSIFDAYRHERLDAIDTFAALPEAVGAQIVRIAEILLQRAETHNVLTPGVLRDLLLGCIYAEAGQEEIALGQQVADKLLHQVKGDPAVLTALDGACQSLPNRSEITTLIWQMGGLGGGTTITPLL